LIFRDRVEYSQRYVSTVNIVKLFDKRKVFFEHPGRWARLEPSSTRFANIPAPLAGEGAVKAVKLGLANPMASVQTSLGIPQGTEKKLLFACNLLRCNALRKALDDA